MRELSAQGLGVYITQKGEKMGGLVLLKLSSCNGDARLLTQQRNFDTDILEWVNVFAEDIVMEKKADEYIQRAVSRDPDLWVVEIEDKEMRNPFTDDLP